MARFKSNKKKLYIGFIGEREAAEYIATSNIGPFTHFSFRVLSKYFKFIATSFCVFHLLQLQPMPTTDLSSMPPQKNWSNCGSLSTKLQPCSRGNRFLIDEMQQSIWKNYNIVSLESRLPDKVQQTYFAFTFFVTFYPSPSSFLSNRLPCSFRNNMQPNTRKSSIICIPFMLQESHDFLNQRPAGELSLRTKNEYCRRTYVKCISTCHCHIIFLRSNFSNCSFSLWIDQPNHQSCENALFLFHECTSSSKKQLALALTFMSEHNN